MKATFYSVLLSMALALTMTAIPASAYTYYQYPAQGNIQQQQNQPIPPFFPFTLTHSQDDVADTVEETLEQQKESVDQYLNGLLNALGNYGAPENVQETVEEQVEQAQETNEQANEYVKDIFNSLLDVIYGPKNDTDEDDKTTTASPRYVTQGVEDEQEDDDDVTTVASSATTTSEDDEDSDEATTAAPSVTTEDDVDEDSEDATTTAAPVNNESEEEEDDDITTTAPTVVTTTENDADEDEDDSEMTTASSSVESDEDSDDEEKRTTTAATIDRTLSTVDEDNDDSEEDDNVTTTTTSTTTTTTTTTNTTEDNDSEEEDDEDSTTTATPVTSPFVPNLCDDCDFKHGVGFNPHPSDCTLFVQCRMSEQGVPVVAGVQSCPHGLYWNQDKLVCDFKHNVKCVDDVCRGHKQTKRSGASCRGYWDCTSGSAAAKCCAEGFAFNPVTALCQYDPSCQDECLPGFTKTNYECNGMRAVPGDRTAYEVKTADTWKRMYCPPNVAFSTLPCGCSIHLNQQPTAPVCAPELYLPFNNDAKDLSGYNIWVKNEGVVVKNGEAFFDGNSRLIVNRFSGAWWGTTVFVQLRYRSLDSNKRQALVSNGDCQVRPSLAVCTGPRGVDFYAETKDSAMPANFTVPYGYSEGEGWQDVLYRLDGNRLHGYLDNRMTSAPAEGILESRQRGLVIGSGGGCDDFEGYIDELTVYLCRPSLQK